MTSSVYLTGTVSVSNGSVTVTGTGTAWAIALVTGGMFSFAGMSVPIASVESDTSLTLAYAWPGADATGAYAIARETSEAVRAAWINDRLATLMAKPWGTGVLPDGRGTLAERDALSPMPTDKYCWLREETGFDPTLYFKTPSGWIGPYPLVGEQGATGPAGTLNWIEAGWVTATAYAVNDGLTRNGTSYRCYVAHNSAAATEPGVGANWATVWKVTAAKGDTGPAIGALLTTRGDLPVQGVSAAQRLAIGAAGTVLRSTGTDPVWSSAREVLTANRLYFVRTDGSDANSGLANTSGGAFLTIQKALNVIATLDLGGFNVTISVADGTYTGSISMNKPVLGGSVNLSGNASTPANCIISHSAFGAFGLSGAGTALNISGFRIENSAASSLGQGVLVSNGAVLTIVGAMDFGACTRFHMEINTGGTVSIGAGYTISGDASRHWSVDAGRVVLSGQTITMSGTRAFSVFASVTNGGGATIFTLTKSGTATGKYYDVTLNGVINTFGGGATALFGSVAGTTATGGQYV